MINKRRILLTPEIGDWTQFVAQEAVKDTTIGTVGISKFDRLSKDELVQAHRLHYKGYEAFINNLTDTLKIKSDLYSLEIIQMVYSNYQRVLGEGFFQVSVLVENRYSFNLYFQNTIANIMIDRALGGKGDASIDNMSKVENKVFEKVVEQVMRPLFVYWNIDMSAIKVTEVINSTKEDLTLNPQSSYVMLLGKLAVGNNPPGIIAFGYGRDTLIELLDRYEKNEYQTRRRNVELGQKTRDKIKMKFKVEVGSTEITMKELISLREGDVLKLDTPVNSFIKGKLAGTMTFNCFPGLKDDYFAVQVLGAAGRNEQEDERQLRDSGIVLLSSPAVVPNEAVSPVSKTESQSSVNAETFISKSDKSADSIIKPILLETQVEPDVSVAMEASLSEPIASEVAPEQIVNVDEGFSWDILGDEDVPVSEDVI